MAAVLRTSYRSLNRNSDTYLEMIARHRFHEGRKENNYEVAKRHLKICEQTCTRLRSTGDLSVCYWTLGELASNKQYFSKASMFYEKAISTYDLARFFSQFQPSLSVIYARYSYAQAGKNRLLPQPTCDVEDEHRPNPQSEPEHLNQPIRSSSVDESRTPSPTQGTLEVDRNSMMMHPQMTPELALDTHGTDDSGTTESLSMLSDYESDILWPIGESCQQSGLELEEAVEEVGSSDVHVVNTPCPYASSNDGELTHMSSTMQRFFGVHGDHNPQALVSIT